MVKKLTLRQESRMLGSRGYDIAVAIAFLAFVALAVLVLLARLIFDYGQVWLQDAVLWLHAALFLAGAWAATRADAHVRIEIWRDRMAPARRRGLDRLGDALLSVPMMSVLVWSSWAPVRRAWEGFEASSNLGGLPGLFLLKSLLPLLACAMLALACRRILSRHERP